MNGSLLNFIVILSYLTWTNSCWHRIPAIDLSLLKSGQTFDRQGSFRIGPGDELNVLVYGEDKLSGTFRVSPTGFLSIPLLPTLQVKGLTPSQLGYKLKNALRKLIKAPKVSVSLTGVRSFQVYFAGEVQRIGSINLTSETNFLQAITLAGGLTEFASGRIVLIRKIGTNKTQRYATTYKEVLSGKNFLDQVTLESGDIIIAE